jgi:hypothetical protein
LKIVVSGAIFGLESVALVTDVCTFVYATLWEKSLMLKETNSTVFVELACSTIVVVNMVTLYSDVILTKYSVMCMA